ncbi:MAG: alkaline phosphatase family protein [Thermoplasmata archaeon]|nr:alkaline phosphatase family protein [Thermoplasmata archaeon]
MRSIVIGVDGAEPSLLEKWIDELPNFQKFYPCYAKMESTLPPSSAPAWTSIVTGVKPEKHGIYDFFYYDDAKDEIKVVSSRMRRMPALWNLLDSVGKRSIVINVPLTYPPERINGIIVSGLLTPPGEKFVEPAEIQDLLSDYKMEHLIVDDLPIRMAAQYNPEKVMNLLNEWIESRTRAAIRLMKKFPWDFGMVVYRATDLVQHFMWGRDEVFEIYKKIDGEIGKIMENFRANYFIVSDHGFYGVKKNVFLNNFLYEKGYIVAKGKPKSVKMGKILMPLLHHMPRKFTHLPFMRKLLFSLAFKKNLIDMEKSLAFCLSSSSRAIICKRGMEEEIKKLLEELEDGGKRLMKIENAYSTGKISYLISELQEEYAIMDMLNFGDVISEPEKFHFHGEHAKYGIFMAYGENISDFEHQVSVTDVAPTLLHSMNLPVASHMDGDVIPLFKHGGKVKKVDWEKFGLSSSERKKLRNIASSLRKRQR